MTRRRLKHVTAVLEDEGPAARRWWWAWTVGYGTLAVAQGVGVPLARKADRQQLLAVGSIASGVSTLLRILTPFPPARADRELARLPARTPAERREKLREGEQLLKASARAEERGDGLLARAISLVVPSTSALVLWLAFDQPRRAAANLAGGLVMAEITFQTQPTGAIDAWERYRHRYQPDVARAWPRRTARTPLVSRALPLRSRPPTIPLFGATGHF